VHRTALLATLIVLAGCGDGGTDAATVVLEGTRGSTTIAAEVADSSEERNQGLRGREELEPDSGMVFLFDEPVSAQFVMEDTLIPLSIAFVDGAGRIVAIEDMEPCRSEPCPTYGAEQPFTTALEVNQGAFDRWGVGVGDRVRVETHES
jgi:uncharacterized membrane protein (UPF0127 family)